MTLVSLELTKSFLRIDDDEEDELIDRLIENASVIVTDYVKVDDTAYDVTLPRNVEQALLLVIRNLYKREDEDPLTPAVRSLLHRERDPAIA